MAQTKSQIQALLTDADTAPRHRFGQNFMIDQNLVRTVVAAGNITADDSLIEVGPGTGTLTEELLASPAKKVLAVEIDRDLAKMLRNRFAENAKFSLIEGDALSGKHELNADLLAAINPPPTSPSPGTPGEGGGEGDFGSRDIHEIRNHPHPNPLPEYQERGPETQRLTKPTHKLIANLPYNIASPLVIELLLAGVETLVFTVQKEVADRLRASAGSDAYGPLTVMAQMLSTVELLRTLPPQAFWPAPKIDSALVRMIRRDRLGPGANAFGRFVHQVFSFRRKTLRKSLAMSGFYAEMILEKTGLNGQQRPEEFTPEQFLLMYEAAK